MSLERSTKPYTRWWWFSQPIQLEDIRKQLAWVKDQNFGGVEVAWIYPLNPQQPGVPFLGSEWRDLVAETKKIADELELGCDFTFGTMWPFGGSFVKAEDALKTFSGMSADRLSRTWETPDRPVYIIDHLSKRALRNYSSNMLQGLTPALAGKTSALFCDSWEVNTYKMWSDNLWDQFEQRFGYSLKSNLWRIDLSTGLRYDYRTFISDLVISEFFAEFTNICHENNAVSRVQCGGAPVDLLRAYGSVDLPESEAMLFNPQFSRIPSSAGALYGKNVISSETFTCMYGFPKKFHKLENIHDMKLVADAIIANGVNHIFWHGMPFDPERNEFYATIHVGPNANFAPELKAFNAYLAETCEIMRKGRTYATIGCYLPREDMMVLDTLPENLRVPGSLYYYEMRYIDVAAEHRPFQPLWINDHSLENASVENGSIRIGDQVLQGIYVDVKYLAPRAIDALIRLAQQGASIVIVKNPSYPGYVKLNTFDQKVRDLLQMPTVKRDWRTANWSRLIECDEELPFYWARKEDDTLCLFFAHPMTKNLKYPVAHNISEQTAERVEIPLKIKWLGREFPTQLVFDGTNSILLKVDASGVLKIDAGF